MEDQTNHSIEQSKPTKYASKKIRIGADIPRELKIRLNAEILPGMLSSVIRELLEGYLAFSKEVGASLAMRSVIKKDLSVDLNHPYYNEDDTP